MHAISPATASIIPPELTVPPPRNPRLSGGGFGAIAFFVAFLAFVLFLGSDAWKDALHEIPDRAALHADANETAGTFLKWKQRKSDTAIYTFTVNGKAYTGQARVPVQFLYSVGHSNSLPIRYLPSNPSINHPADWEWSPILDWEAPLFLSIMIMPGYMLLTIRMERQLLAQGTPTIAVVSKCSTGGRGGIFLKYEFRSQDGTIIQGSASSQTPRDVGDQICVLYMPQSPSRNQPYPPSFHQPLE